MEKEAKHLEGLSMEQMIALPLMEVAKAQVELCADGAEKMQQCLAGAVPQEKKKEP